MLRLGGAGLGQGSRENTGHSSVWAGEQLIQRMNPTRAWDGVGRQGRARSALPGAIRQARRARVRREPDSAGWGGARREAGCWGWSG